MLHLPDLFHARAESDWESANSRQRAHTLYPCTVIFYV